MAKQVILSKDLTINGEEYTKGTELKVCDELAEQLIADGEAKEPKK